MLGEIAKLFDRNFAVAYFLPAAGFVSATHFASTHVGAIQPIFIMKKEALFENVTLFVIATLLVAIILSVLNRGVVRLLEGYWPFRQYLNFVERYHYRKLLEEERQIESERKKYSADNLPANIRLKRQRIRRKKATRFPDQPHLILPTAFGNTFRAFETYPFVVYGIDAIPGWFRLLGVVPADYRVLIDASRARIDLWVNVCFLAALTLFEYLGIAYYFKYRGITPREDLWWFPIAMLLLALLAYRLATSAAAEWGNWVKAAFDLYLPELRKKLEFPESANPAEGRATWEKFSQAAVYRSAKAMPSRTSTPPHWYDSKDWQNVLQLAKLHFTRNGLEVLLTILRSMEEPKPKKDTPKN